MSEEGPGAAPTLADLGRVKLSRQAALIRRWAGGSILSAEEMADVAHVLPPAVLADPPRPRPKYLHEYDYYAAQLGYHVRNIKHWVTLGCREARLPPPLDDAEALVGWWERMRALGHLKQQVPQRILDYAHKAQAAAAAAAAASSHPAGKLSVPAPAPAAPGATPAPTSAPGTARVKLDELQAVGLAGAVAELSVQLAAAQKLLRESRETGMDEITINRRQKAFDSILDSLRKTEDSWHKLQEARGELAPVSDFRRDLLTIATTLRGMMRRRADNVCAALAGALSVEQLALVRSAIEKEGAREQALLRSARHWQPASASSAAEP